MYQIIGHFIGDYLLQTAFMANNKSKSHLAALLHVFFYGLGVIGFALLCGQQVSLTGAALILGSHFFIDRYRLPKYLIYARDWIIPPFKGTKWADCNPQTGFDKRMPDWLAGWLFVISDNTLHLGLNWIAFTYLSSGLIC